MDANTSSSSEEEEEEEEMAGAVGNTTKQGSSAPTKPQENAVPGDKVRVLNTPNFLAFFW